ncbi:MAG: arylsulfatase [Gemmatimonadales bacterium]
MRIPLTLALVASLALTPAAHAQKAAKKPGGKPNILVIWGDDIGYWNISAYNLGQMGYKTPNIDRIAREGALFTDLYGQQSCTAGRGAFLTGQSPFRTGLLKVGLPGAKEGLQPEDATVAELLKPQGYVTGQFGKNHLGDLDAMLPTMHGFDEFFGSLYHLNAEEEPENPDYPKDPAFRAKYAPRGVLHSWALPNGGQRIENTGPLTKKRMETIDEEFEAAAKDFITKSAKGDKPFFVWFNSTRMHIWTHLQPKSEGVTGLGVYPDGMVEHDALVGRLLALLDSLGIADNTIVMYSTDNGAEKFSWPDGGTSPFRNEKASNWEGAFRVPGMIKWPGTIKPGTVLNDIVSHEDWVPTLVSAAGNPNVKEQLLNGYAADGKTFKVHLDGYNLTDYLSGKGPDPRKDFFYFNDDGSLVGLRYNQYKVVFAEQRADGLDVWQDPFVPLRFPKLFNLRSDPFETADHESINYGKWRIEHAFVLVPAQEYVGRFLASFKDFPPRQKAGSFSVDDALNVLLNGNQQNNEVGSGAAGQRGSGAAGQEAILCSLPRVGPRPFVPPSPHGGEGDRG